MGPKIQGRSGHFTNHPPLDDDWFAMLNEPLFWLGKVESLRGAAELLLKHIEFRDQGLMLAGYSVEVVLKALAIHADRRLVESGEVKLGHDLPSLADKANVNPTTSERKLLALLTHFVVYAGRYPTARRIRETAVSYGTSGADIVAFEATFDRFYSLAVSRIAPLGEPHSPGRQWIRSDAG